ncbi:MAG: FGGY-family carbohydrate kinase, partial [Anaerolineae bacterium]|nr:FGGY-family carbohydrate kinase [Anaerolineae bacterium]
EQNPQDWWEAVCNSGKKLLSEAGVARDDIACITFSGQMMGCVPLDENAKPLRNAIIWADTRSLDQAQWVGERVSADDVYHITGHRLSSSYSLTKMLWLRDHQPEIYKNTYKFVHAKDSIVARMTGAFVTDRSDASSMNLYDINTGVWSDQIVQAVEIDPGQLPDIHDSVDVVGYLQASVADDVGVAAGTPVVIGGGDGPCASAGAGVVSEGAAYNYVGSSSWIALATSQPIFDPDKKTFTFGHIVPGMVMPTGTMQAAGASYQWARDQLSAQEVAAGKQLGISEYELMNQQAAKSPAGANGLFFLPYLMGERSPRWNPHARAAFVGLTIRHTRADMIRSVLEGVTYNLRVIMDAFQAQGIDIESMRVIGGGARGRFWNQMMANIYGVPVHRLAILEEATSMGAALAGGVGVGLYKDFSMIDQMNAIAETIQPDADEMAAYARHYPIFNSLYEALIPIYEEIAAL